jgi:hypothetical protein
VVVVVVVIDKRGWVGGGMEVEVEKEWGSGKSRVDVDVVDYHHFFLTFDVFWGCWM